jgi:hypothetical protein
VPNNGLLKSSKRCDRATTFYTTEVTIEFLNLPAMPLLMVLKDYNYPAVYKFAYLLRFCAFCGFLISGGDRRLGPDQAQQHLQRITSQVSSVSCWFNRA